MNHRWSESSFVLIAEAFRQHADVVADAFDQDFGVTPMLSKALGKTTPKFGAQGGFQRIDAGVDSCDHV